MPENARLWVYQADRPFTFQEEEAIRELTQHFVGQWAAHGQPLRAASSIEHHQFIILAVDESMHTASGCSIDASVGLIREIQDRFQVNLLDRTKIAFLIDGKVTLVPMTQLKDAINTGQIDAQTKVFNNAIDKASEWKAHWLQPAGETWMKRYFQ